MSAQRDSYVIKSGGRPSGDPSKYDFGEIQLLLDATNPAKVSAAGYAYNSAARIMAQVAHELYLVGKNLAGKWEGADAAAAQQALGQLYATANELYWRSQQTGGALQTYGAALPQYKGLKWPAGGASPVEDTARQQAAEKVMQAVNQHIGNAWDAMPDKVQADLPDLRHPKDGKPYPSGPNVRTTGSGSSVPGGGGRGGGPSGHVPLPHVPHGGGASLAGGAAGGHGADLAGLPQAGGALTPPPPAAGPSVAPGTPGGIPNSPNGGFVPGGGIAPSFPGGGFGSGLVREGSGLGGISPEEPTSLTRPPTDPAAGAGPVEEAEAAQASRSGLAGAGGGPAAGGQREMERPRSTWLAEDSQTWTAGEEAAPSVLGASPASGDMSHEDTERERVVWLDEEHEVWTGGETTLEGTIGAASDRCEAAVDRPETEPDILDVEQLQELLDSIDTGPEISNDNSTVRAQYAGLFENLDVAEVNEIGRLLDG